MRPLEKLTRSITSVRLQFLPAKKISSRLIASFPHTMLKSFLAACAVLATGSAAVAAPFVNVETNAGFLGSNYAGAVTDMHIGVEGTSGAASWYLQGGPALVNPDGAEAEVELSGKLGASIAASSKLSVYGELSGVTGDSANSYGVKAGAKYAF